MGNTAPTVLVVDDMEINVMMLEEILKTDYNIITASNGKEALDRLRTAAILPKLILLDVMMPEMNGRQMFEIMKKDRALQRIPVIFITAENDSESELLAAGAVDFINKPFLPEIVHLRVRNQIELKNYSDSLEQMVAEKTAEVTKTLDNALQGLANVIEHRDLESGEHVKRTQLYVSSLCDYLIISGSPYAQEVLDLRPDVIMKSMALHDVGKIAIPDRILLKPGRLDPEEYDIMKTHTIRGKEIIAELGDINSSLYLKHCEDICYGHHERWDGKGYPRQLKEKDIPLTARLAAIADVYDALVCARVYKAAFPYSEAVKIITDGSGTQFDPVLAEALTHVQGRFQEISERYK
jgi:putative two-component system response regulator